MLWHTAYDINMSFGAHDTAYGTWKVTHCRAEEGILQRKRPLEEYEEEQRKRTKDHRWDQAFRMDFKDPVDFVQYLEEHIQDGFKKYKTHYNYIALVQSSGYGKTRAVGELSKKGYWIILFCFRGIGSSGFPLETPKSGEFLKELKECRSVDEAANICLYWIGAAVQIIAKEKYMPEQLWEMQMIQKDKLYSFWNEIAQIRKSFKGSTDEVINNTKKLCEEQLSGKVLCLFDEASALFDGNVNIDESSNLPYRGCRRALAYISSIFGIMTDTNSSVANLVPQAKDDKSSRIIKDTNMSLLDPFIHVATTDIFSKSGSLPQEIQELQGQQGFDICQFGRPLWIAYIVANKNVKGTILFAQSKLLGGMDPSVLISNDNDMGKNQIFAILISNDNDMGKNHAKRKIVLSHFGCTAGLHLCPKMELPSQLAGNHMATIVAINEDRTELLACYPSEPILAEAAMKILSVDNYRIKAIEILNSIIWEGCIVDAGDRGELGMRIVLLTAWMHTKPLDFYSRRINVLDFLQALFPQSNINTCTMWEDYEVGFTHFIPITYQPNMDTIKKAWGQYGAIILKRCQQGGDLMLIVQNKKTSNFGCIVVQIKNWARRQTNFDDEVGRQLEATHVFSEELGKHIGKELYLGIYVHLGEAYTDDSSFTLYDYSKTGNRWKLQKTDGDKATFNRIVVLGLSNFYRNNDSEELKTMKSLVRAWDNPLQWNEQSFDNKRKALVSSMIP
ncbi:3030_t:CDS:10, partial [Entrophospora sp. SA101]